MILESYVLALLNLIKDKKITLEQIKNEDYKIEVESRLNAE